MSLSNLTSEQRTLLRLALLVSAPLALSVLVSVLILSSVVVTTLDRRASSLGQVMAEQLAVSSSEYLLAGDLLSLNVLLTTLVEQRHLKGASIYSADNRLLVEAGETSSEAAQLFAAEIHYQDSIAGYIRIELDRGEQDRSTGSALIRIILFNSLLLLAAVAAIYRYPSSVLRLLAAPGETLAAAPPSTSASPDGSPAVLSDAATADEPLPSVQGDGVRGLTLLVIKLKPVRLARELDGAIGRAISLYQGEIIARQEDEWTARFMRTGDHCFQAICAASVIRMVTLDSRPGLSFDGGIHCVEGVDPDDAAKVAKQAIYLASLRSGKLLSSAQPLQQPAVVDRVAFSEFHSFLAPDSKVFTIDALKDPYQGLIERQAHMLKSQSGSTRRRAGPERA